MNIRSKIFFALATLLFATIPTYAGAVTIITQPANQLGVVAYWSFDSSTVTGDMVADLSGNGHDLTLQNGTTITGGYSGQAATFDGNNDYATGFVGPLPDTVAISLWVKANNLSEQSVLAEQDNGSPGAGYHFDLVGIKDGAFFAGFWNIGDIASSPIQTGVWYNVVLSYDNNAHTQSLYVNGVLQGTQGGTWSPPSQLYFLPGLQQQGCSFTSASGYCNDLATYFNGQIDEMHVYNRALSSTDVSNLQSARTRLGVSNTGLSGGLVDYWPLDGATTNWATNKTNDIVGGSTANLVSMSTTTSPVAGKIGQALKFAGGYVSANAAAPTTVYSVSAWIHYQGATPISNIKVAVSYGSNGPDSTLWMGYASDGKLAISNSSFDIKSPIVSNSTTWHHLVATVSGGVLSAYMDGALINTTSMSARLANTLLLGEYVGSIGTFSFPGAVDDVRVYSRALSAAEVRQLYAIGNAGANVSHSVSGSGARAPLSQGLVGYWTFDGSQTSWSINTTQDSSGQGNTGTLVGLATTTAPVAGKLGQALGFNGSSSYITIPNSASLEPAAISFGAWFKALSTTTNIRILSKTEAGGYSLAFNDTVAGLDATVNVGGTYYYVSYTNIVQNAWYHAMATYDGETLRLYVNGVDVSDNTAPSGAIRYTGTIRDCIGSEAGSGGCGAGNFFNGSIDEVRVYNRALSAGEVQQFYQLGK